MPESPAFLVYGGGGRIGWLVLIRRPLGPVHQSLWLESKLEDLGLALSCDKLHALIILKLIGIGEEVSLLFYIQRLEDPQDLALPLC